MKPRFRNQGFSPKVRSPAAPLSRLTSGGSNRFRNLFVYAGMLMIVCIVCVITVFSLGNHTSATLPSSDSGGGLRSTPKDNSTPPPITTSTESPGIRDGKDTLNQEEQIQELMAPRAKQNQDESHELGNNHINQHGTRVISHHQVEGEVPRLTKETATAEFITNADAQFEAAFVAQTAWLKERVPKYLWDYDGEMKDVISKNIVSPFGAVDEWEHPEVTILSSPKDAHAISADAQLDALLTLFPKTRIMFCLPLVNMPPKLRFEFIARVDQLPRVSIVNFPGNPFTPHHAFKVYSSAAAPTKYGLFINSDVIFTMSEPEECVLDAIVRPLHFLREHYPHKAITLQVREELHGSLLDGHTQASETYISKAMTPGGKEFMMLRSIFMTPDRIKWRHDNHKHMESILYMEDHAVFMENRAAYIIYDQLITHKEMLNMALGYKSGILQDPPLLDVESTMGYRFPSITYIVPSDLSYLIMNRVDAMMSEQPVKNLMIKWSMGYKYDNFHLKFINKILHLAKFNGEAIMQSGQALMVSNIAVFFVYMICGFTHATVEWDGPGIGKVTGNFTDLTYQFMLETGLDSWQLKDDASISKRISNMRITSLRKERTPLTHADDLAQLAHLRQSSWQRELTYSGNLAVIHNPDAKPKVLSKGRKDGFANDRNFVVQIVLEVPMGNHEEGTTEKQIQDLHKDLSEWSSSVVMREDVQGESYTKYYHWVLSSGFKQHPEGFEPENPLDCVTPVHMLKNLFGSLWVREKGKSDMEAAKLIDQFHVALNSLTELQDRVEGLNVLVAKPSSSDIHILPTPHSGRVIELWRYSPCTIRSFSSVVRRFSMIAESN